MRTQKSVRRCLLAATLAGTPLYVSAAETASPDKYSSQTEPATLRPVSVTALKTVPQSNGRTSGIQLAQYQPGAKQKTHKTSAVNAELQRLFYENGQSMPSMRPQGLPNTNGPAVRMVRHRKDAAKPKALSRDDAKKPSLLKRFLNTFKPKNSGEGEEFTDSDLTGRPAIPAVPPPPPIVYEQNSNAQRSGKSVAARVAGYRKGNGQSTFSAAKPRVTNEVNQKSAQPLIPSAQVPPTNTPLTGQPATQKPAGSDARFQQPPQYQVYRDDGFVDPFDASELTDEENTLLDLESLTNDSRIGEDESPPPSPPQHASESIADQNSIAQESAAGPESSVPSQAPERDLTNNPFTGYRLDADGQISRERTEETTTSSQAPVEVTDVPLTRALPEIEEPETAPGQTQEEVEQTAAPEKPSQIVKIPLLEQEEVPLPSVTSEAARTPAADTVPTGRELAAQIELKPAPERLRQLSEKSRREAQRYRIMSRAGQAGFKGFCPVVLRNQRELRDGRKEFQSRFGLKTYYFSSPEARDTFEANPARYAPAGGGSDVVLLVNTNEEVAGILDYSLWYRDRLYMFRSRETQAIFSQDPQRYASQY